MTDINLDKLTRLYMNNIMPVHEVKLTHGVNASNDEIYESILEDFSLTNAPAYEFLFYKMVLELGAENIEGARLSSALLTFKQALRIMEEECSE